MHAEVDFRTYVTRRLAIPIFSPVLLSQNTKTRMAEMFPVKSASFLLDFASCSAATALCSIMSTPQVRLPRTSADYVGIFSRLFSRTCPIVSPG